AVGQGVLGVELLRDALRDRARRDPAGLGVADLALATAPELERDLRDLGGLARAGRARDDHDLVVADRSGDLLTAPRDGQRGRVVDLRDDDGAAGLGAAARPGEGSGVEGRAVRGAAVCASAFTLVL